MGKVLCQISDTAKRRAKVPVDISGSTIEFAGKTITQGIFKDISERQRAEAERLRFSKLESLGYPGRRHRP